MKIIDIINQEQMSLSFEVFPPKKETSFESVRMATEEIAALKPAFMSVTYGAGGGTSEYTLAVAKNINKIANINSDETTAYLFRTAKNTALNVYSKKKRQAEREILVDNYCDIDNISDGELIGEAEKTQFEEVVSCIESLPEHYRTVLGLHFRQEYTAPQIAKTLGIKISTVKQRLVRGKKMLLIKLREVQK